MREPKTSENPHGVKVGLLETGAIGRVLVDPADPQRLFVAAMGQLWTPGVTVEVETDMNSASLHVEQSLLAAAGTCRPVAESQGLPYRDLAELL